MLCPFNLIGGEKMDIPEQEWKEILNEIEKADSPVGIDAKKTHIIIIHKLNEIEKRLEQLEKK